ncbi:exopolyphosphatase [Weissella halotolerans]|uniref:Exopolyphosphatase n=1 Tax=Weissella halotolerans DSM 20190 TaxID=1123500 RepID=A0A0R2G1G2_9LACO|nr:exopolyphosphatase [Weissella halotolerans]KRN31244.1 exopolyphosphatase [Weissella halotolerans DSM 20190]
MSYLAVVDFGSNSTRMVVEELTATGTFKEVQREKVDTRLAQGMHQNGGALTQAAMERVEQALIQFQAIYRQYPNVKVEGIATAAIREATNQKAFLAHVFETTGIDVQVLTGDQEAYYDYLGAMSALPKIEDAWLLDTGGASVELVGIEERMAANFISLPFGAVNLSERFQLGFETVSAKQLQAAEAYVSQQFDSLPWLVDEDPLPIILLGGANRSLARLNRGRQGFDTKTDFHGYHMTTAEVLTTFDELVALTYQERRELLGKEANRADIIISGLVPLIELIQRTDAKEVVFSSSGVREGFLQECRLAMEEN